LGNISVATCVRETGIEGGGPPPEEETPVETPEPETPEAEQ
jgi:hypothetical protein